MSSLLRDGRVRRSMHLGLAGQDTPMPLVFHRLTHDRGITRISGMQKAQAWKPASVQAKSDRPHSGRAGAKVDDLHRLLTEERIGELMPLKIVRRRAQARARHAKGSIFEA